MRSTFDYYLFNYAKHLYRNRYLILDVLGQGTFGQVVKCQNLKTQEVVAVKVIKNRTAYFNQSMMEVSVLDLVRIKHKVTKLPFPLG